MHTYLDTQNNLRASKLGTLVHDHHGRLAVRAAGEAASDVPKVQQRVIARVTRVQHRMVHLDLLALDERPLRKRYAAVLRRDDVRKADVDALKMHDAFRANDIVQARVLSLGDSRAYYLTTADDELGVVMADSSRSGKPLTAISADEMECAETGERERRKVARLSYPVG